MKKCRHFLRRIAHLRRDTTRLSQPLREGGGLSSGDVFQETSARYRAVEPAQWLNRHPEAGSSWPSWPKAFQEGHQQIWADKYVMGRSGNVTAERTMERLIKR